MRKFIPHISKIFIEIKNLITKNFSPAIKISPFLSRQKKFVTILKNKNDPPISHHNSISGKNHLKIQTIKRKVRIA
jgi:hypothetical protein